MHKKILNCAIFEIFQIFGIYFSFHLPPIRLHSTSKVSEKTLKFISVSSKNVANKIAAKKLFGHHNFFCFQKVKPLLEISTGQRLLKNTHSMLILQFLWLKTPSKKSCIRERLLLAIAVDGCYIPVNKVNSEKLQTLVSSKQIILRSWPLYK